MDQEEVLAEVGIRIGKIPCVRTYRYITEQMRRDIIALEREAELHSVETGIMPFINRGVWSVFERRFQVVIIMETACEILAQGKNLVTIVDPEGHVIGEWLSEEKREEVVDRKDVRMIGKDFALYSDVEMSGKPFFVLPEIEFHYLDGVAGVRNVTSGSLSPPADLYVHKSLMLDDPTLATHLVGFDLDQ